MLVYVRIFADVEEHPSTSDVERRRRAIRSHNYWASAIWFQLHRNNRRNNGRRRQQYLRRPPPYHNNRYTNRKLKPLSTITTRWIFECVGFDATRVWRGRQYFRGHIVPTNNGNWQRVSVKCIVYDCFTIIIPLGCRRGSGKAWC